MTEDSCSPGRPHQKSASVLAVEGFLLSGLPFCACHNRYGLGGRNGKHMSRDPLISKQPNLWRRFAAFKTLMVTFSLASLLVSNVVSLVSASAHDWMHDALWRVLSIGGQAVADRALANSPKGKSASLEARAKELNLLNRNQTIELDQLKIRNQNLARKLDVSGKQAKQTVATVHNRLAKGIARNLASIPSEAIPVVGIGVTLAMTSMDIYDACQTMKDFNSLLVLLEQGEERSDLCGQKVPTREEVIQATCAKSSVPFLCAKK
jgi:hypothetical protein